MAAVEKNHQVTKSKDNQNIFDFGSSEEDTGFGNPLKMNHTVKTRSNVIPKKDEAASKPKATVNRVSDNKSTKKALVDVFNLDNEDDEYDTENFFGKISENSKNPKKVKK